MSTGYYDLFIVGCIISVFLVASGDTLFAHSVGRTDLDGGDEAKLNASLLRLAKLPDDLRVLPGHGPETNIGKERAHNPFWPVQS